MADRLSKAKEFAGAKWADVSASVGHQRKLRGLRNEITDLVRTRDRFMSDMGHMVYTLHGRGKVRNADLLAVCERVDEINASVDELNRQIQELTKPAPRGQVEEVELEDETEFVEAEEEGEEEPDEPDEGQEVEEQEPAKDTGESEDEPEADPE